MKLSRLRKLSWKLFLVFGLVIVMTAFADPSTGKWKSRHFAAGVALLALSTWVRLWAAGHLVKNKVLTVTGPYAHVKNPLYIGTFIGMLGFALVTRGDPAQPLWVLRHLNWIVFGAGVLLFAAYYVPYKKKREGDRLHDIFGEAWDHYDRAVPDYFPKRARYERAESRPWSWSAACANSEQWTPLSISAGLAAVIWNGPLLRLFGAL